VEEMWKTTFTYFEESPLKFLRKKSGKPQMLHSIVETLNKAGY
jgi:hypothetical protein